MNSKLSVSAISESSFKKDQVPNVEYGQSDLPNQTLSDVKSVKSGSKSGSESGSGGNLISSGSSSNMS